MDMPMIAVSNLTKSYGTTQALKGITFSVPRGQVVGFLGPNGAGKSTTMKILTGFVEPSQGSVLIGGVDTQTHAIEARRKVGYLPENNPLYEDMLVIEYLEYLADVRHLSKSVRKTSICNTIDKCGLGNKAGSTIGELSKGYRQRVGLAQAILHDPDLLVLDEPTTGLDPNQIVEIRQLIRELGQEKTVLMSTHVLPEVQATCSRVLIIADGKLVADDAPEHLMTEGGLLFVTLAAADGTPLTFSKIKVLFSSLPDVQEVSEQENTEAGACSLRIKHGKVDIRRDVFQVSVNNGLVILALERRQISLEETFRRLTTQDSIVTNSPSKTI